MLKTLKVVLLGSVLVMVGCKATPIMNVTDKAIVGEHELTVIEKSIMKASIRKGWQPKKISEGVIEAKINVRNKHYATVSILYSEKSFSINYVDSKGLGVKRNKIHKSYNRWIANLTKEIEQEILFSDL